MGYRIPKAIEPHFNSIIADANSHPWLVKFYHEEIKDVIFDAIENQIFQSAQFKSQHPNATVLDKLNTIKLYFDSKHNESAVYDPLKQVFFSISSKQKGLQDNWFKAMAARLEPINLNEGLPAYTFEVIREVMTREILLYIQRALKKNNHLKSRAKFNQLQYWVKKELGHLGPIAGNTSLDNQRFEKIHDPKHFEFDIGNLLGDAWYFINGVNRTPLFLQCELIAIKSMFKDLKLTTDALSRGDHAFAKLLFIGLPISTFKFILGFGYLLFAPYRLARTMVNELSELFGLALQGLTRKAGIQTPGNFIRGLSFIAQWACYLGLLWSFGLPFLPNPFAWMPNFTLQMFTLVSLGYVTAATTGAWVTALTRFLRHDPIYYLGNSVANVEMQVEKGLEAVDKVHQEIFEYDSPGYTPRFIKSRRPSSSSSGATNHTLTSKPRIKL